MSKILSADSMVSKGLLIIRIGFGIMFMFHGAPKLFGGQEVWTKVGRAVSKVGIHDYFAFWGFMAGLTEFGGRLLLMLGLFQRIVCIFLVIVMVVAAYKHYTSGDGFKSYSHPVEAAIVFLGLLFTGPGKYSFSIVLKKKSRN